MTLPENGSQIDHYRQVLNNFADGLEWGSALRPALPWVSALRKAHDPKGVELEKAYLKYLVADIVTQRIQKHPEEASELMRGYIQEMKELEGYLREKGKLPPLENASGITPTPEA